MNLPSREKAEGLIKGLMCAVVVASLGPACTIAPTARSTRITTAGAWETTPAIAVVTSSERLGSNYVDVAPSFSLYRGVAAGTDVGLKLWHIGASVGLGQRIDLGPVELALRPELGLNPVTTFNSPTERVKAAVMAELPMLLGGSHGNFRVVAGPHLRMIYVGSRGYIHSNSLGNYWMHMDPAWMPGAVVALEYGRAGGPHVLFGLQGHRLRDIRAGSTESAFAIQASLSVSFEH